MRKIVNPRDKEPRLRPYYAWIEVTMSWGIRQRNIIYKKVEVLYEITDAKRKIYRI